MGRRGEPDTGTSTFHGCCSQTVPPGAPASLLRKVKVKSFSRVQLLVTPWTVAYQVPPSMGFSKQEYWSGLPFPYPGDLPDLRIEPGSPTF